MVRLKLAQMPEGKTKRLHCIDQIFIMEFKESHARFGQRNAGFWRYVTRGTLD
jgi:hypothetical protein